MSVSEIETMKTRAAALRQELQEIEAALKVFERYSRSGNGAPYIAPAAVIANDQEAYKEWMLANRHQLGAKSALAYCLRQFPDGLHRDVLQDRVRKLGVIVSENTFNWTLSEHKDVFKSLGSGVWALWHPEKYQ